VLVDSLQPEIISEIRERKGMKQELPPSIDYI
jgi:elongation factor 2